MKTFQEYLNESTDDAIKSKLRLLSAVGIDAEWFIKSGLVVVKSKESNASVVRKSMKRTAAKIQMVNIWKLKKMVSFTLHEYLINLDMIKNN